jgi:hypothetical protein
MGEKPHLKKKKHWVSLRSRVTKKRGISSRAKLKILKNFIIVIHDKL